MKKGIALFLAILLVLGCVGCAEKQIPVTAESRQPTGNVLQDTSGREYYMVTFASGIEYWKGCFKGFKKAAALHGAKAVYAGTNELDTTKAIAVLEQVISKNPAGIAVTCLDPDAYIDPINKAIEKGIPVVTFDSDAPQSKRYCFLGTGNKNAGARAAAYMAELLNHKGKVAIISMPGNLTQEERTAGFQDYIKTYEPEMQVVQVGNGEADQTKAASVTAGIIQAHPDIAGFYATNAQSGVGVATAVEESGKKGKIKIISFDTDKGTLDAIKSGTISASIAQGTEQMGFWGFEMLFLTQKGLVIENWKEKGLAPLPASIDTGVSIVTANNVDSFYPAE